SCASTIQALERLHLIHRLDVSVFWAVMEALRQQSDVHLVCNISPLSLQRGEEWQLICSALDGAPDLAQRLTLEVTETAAVFDIDEAVYLLAEIRKRGCRIAFGKMDSGYCSLALAT